MPEPGYIRLSAMFQRCRELAQASGMPASHVDGVTYRRFHELALNGVLPDVLMQRERWYARETATSGIAAAARMLPTSDSPPHQPVVAADGITA